MSGYHSANQTCEWCFQRTNLLQLRKNCQHKTCNKCFMLETTCQSDCPFCWFKNMAQYIRFNKICSVCCTGISSGDPPFLCNAQHLHCSQCPSAGCILCQFRQLKAWNEKPYRDHAAHCQRTLYTCQTWQMKFEGTEHLMSNSSTSVKYNKENPSLLEHDNESQLVSGFPPLEHPKNNSIKNVESGDCMICLERLGSSYKRLKECGHSFHEPCIETWFQSSGKQSCPSCGHVYGISKGPQPENGKMTIRYLSAPLSGFENVHYGYKEGPAIEITYTFPSGIQGPLNPTPNAPFTGTTRKAYLPNNKEGKEILSLLRRAFNDGHIFTIGKSVTTGQDNVVTWNDVHHKTSISGGPERFGYPDPTYLYRVRQELADKGYK